MDAGIRVQAIKRTDGEAGIVHYGTETGQESAVSPSRIPQRWPTVAHVGRMAVEMTDRVPALQSHSIERVKWCGLGFVWRRWQHAPLTDSKRLVADLEQPGLSSPRPG
jgi:hypothetical protein